MNVKILRLFILLLISVGTPLLLPREGGVKGTTPPKSSTFGLHLSVDAFGYIYPIFVKDKYYSTELSATLDINNRFFPTIEIGLGHTDMTSQLYEIGYSTHAPFYRVGMDYNMQYKNKMEQIALRDSGKADQMRKKLEKVRRYMDDMLGNL